MKKQKTLAPVPQTKHSIRIIGGGLRGRKIEVKNRLGLRPSGDRVRETLFNWLQGRILGAKVLDAFAGTGALGIEALSREAERVDFCEKHPATAQDLELVLKKFALADRARVFLTDALALPAAVTPYDLILLDPPFAENLLSAALSKFSNSQWLAPAGMIYYECPRNQEVNIPAELQIYREKQTSNLQFALLRVRAS